MANRTPHAAADYDRNIGTTIPLYDELHRQALDLAVHSGIAPRTWLDTGCGTGGFGEKCRAVFPGIRLVLADPSSDMLDIARARLGGGEDGTSFILAGSQALTCPPGAFDVITAIMSHHYLTGEEKKRALDNCCRMLAPGGLFIAFENAAAMTPRGVEIAAQRWKTWQIAAGASREVAEAHLDRYGRAYFPLTVTEHLQLLSDCGFSSRELFWYSYSQIGVYGIK